jgi:dTDP-4-amino-4,6-dideoxygalactose transaminase
MSELARALAARTGTRPEDWFGVLKARSGMEVAFRVLREVRGPGSVLTQVFTCATAVDPVLAAGLEPRYGEVAPATLALDPARLQVPDDARAVVVQHTFGVVDDAATEALREAALRAGAVLVEDAAHAATRMARRDGAPLADVSVHSFGAEKLLGTKFGGAVWLSPDLDADVRGPLVAALRGLPAPGVRLRFSMRTYRGQQRVLTRLPGGDRLRDALTRLGLHEPPVAPVERAGRLAHPPMRPSRWVERTVLDALAWSGDVQARRAAATEAYARALAGLEMPAVGRAPLVRFPLYAPDAASAERVVETLRAEGVPAGRWYRPALFPGPTDPALYRYEPGTLPVTEDLVERVVNLPTTVTPARAERIAARVRELLG